MLSTATSCIDMSSRLDRIGSGSCNDTLARSVLGGELLARRWYSDQHNNLLVRWLMLLVLHQRWLNRREVV